MPGTRQAPAVDTNCGGLSMFRGRWALTSADGAPGSAQRAQSSSRTEIPFGTAQKRDSMTSIYPNVFSSFRRLVANVLVGRRNPTPQHMKQEQPNGNNDGQA